ncbi:hypothetical protein [Nonomuraea sp. 10N515B]|uniref:hypothetical protein n=1 Tax=Nonomuraea sp. 10N515B TaxID=3457422 RepID=UPI003FCC92C6
MSILTFLVRTVRSPWLSMRMPRPRDRRMSIWPSVMLVPLCTKKPYSGAPVTVRCWTSTSRTPRAYTTAWSPEPEPVTLTVPQTSSTV